MFKARQKRVSLLVACLTALCAMFFAFVGIFSVPTTTASAATTTIVFQLGANGSASHNDGTEKTSYSETKDGYTLSLTGGSKMYTGARDAKGNSCIKLGTSSAAGKFSFTVPSDVTSVIIAVGKYKANTSKVTIGGKTTTLTKSSNDGAYDEITVDTTSTKTVSLTTASGGYRAMVNTITFVVESGDCTCENATSVTQDATCTEPGSITTTCPDCGNVKTETIPATGHSNTEETITEATCAAVGEKELTCTICGNVETVELPKINHDYQDGFCTGCNAPQPLEATLTFDDTAKRTAFSTSQQVWEENGITLTNNKGSSTNNVADYSNPARFYKGSNITIEYPNMVKIDFNCSGSDYSSIPGATKNGNVVTIVLSESTDNYTITLSDGQVRLNSLTVYAEQPKPATKIDSASLSIGSDLSMNYYISNATESMVLYATFNGETFDLEGAQDGDRLKYTLTGITPKEMCDNISVVLMDGETVIAKQENYSIKTYAQNKLDASDSSEELKQLLVDLLYYGAESQKYYNAKINVETNEETLATSGIENLTPSTAMPTDEDNAFSLVNSEAKEYPVYFKGANVEFGDVNKIIVKLSAYDENVTLTVNGEEVELNSATYKTEDILATGFATEYTFVLSYDGNVMQTLTYSVNSYAVRMQNNDEMGELAIALYRYGASAIAYKNA